MPEMDEAEQSPGGDGFEKELLLSNCFWEDWWVLIFSPCLIASSQNAKKLLQIYSIATYIIPGKVYA